MFHGVAERTQAVAVPLAYGAMEAVVIVVYCLWAWKAGWTKAPPDEHLWTVLSQSYEGDNEMVHDVCAVGDVENHKGGVQWKNSPASTVSYSPVGSLDEEESYDDNEDDMVECALISPKRLNYERRDTTDLSTSSEDSSLA